MALGGVAVVRVIVVSPGNSVANVRRRRVEVYVGMYVYKGRTGKVARSVPLNNTRSALLSSPLLLTLLTTYSSYLFFLAR